MDQIVLTGLVALAGVLAGAVNTLAGGGTLLVYPALLAFGLPPLGANVTSLIGLTPGYVGGVYAYRTELAGEKRRLPALIPASVLGAIAGAILLLVTPGETFEAVIPFLVLLSSLLLLAQPWLQRRLVPAAGEAGPARAEESVTSPLTVVSVFLASIYRSYFSAGVGVLLLALLGATIHANFQRINALKNALSLFIVVTGVAIYAFSAHVDWLAVLVLLPSSALGGVLGGRLARRLNPDALRYAVCGLGIVLAVVLFL
ncbi:sulfite exporter TauE/SafE family protein [Glaciibacter sp. 2TAF33]|uniref:sulfite exporter TauE/SafE family protein n=1 Tax=Glaciibacter sp. 2TAF33 TaxID=3233015 RepID=UPI003F8E6681